VYGVLPTHSSPTRPFFILILVPLMFILVPLMFMPVLMPGMFLTFALFAFFLFASFAILFWIFGLRH
jgi:hypothetical protein